MQHCAPGKGDNKSCFTNTQLKKIATAYNQKQINGGGGSLRGSRQNDLINVDLPKPQLWDEIWKKLSDRCQHEYCWVDQDFVLSLRDKEIMNHTFKPKRPLGKYAWLTTSNIHDVMKQYEFLHKDFLFLGPVPMDFNEILPYVGKINIQKEYKKGIRKIGIIFNTDPSDKPGKHWISMFVNLDPKNPTISYFDSFAICPPPQEVQKLINHISSYSPKIYSKNTQFKINCNIVRHQYANSECGVYSIYFILESLRGKTFDQITRKIVKDEEMNKNRDNFFRPPV